MAAAGAALQVVGAGFEIAGAQQKKKGGGMIPQFLKRSLREKLLNNSTYAILDEERGLVEDALAQGAFLQPEMYKALGYEPIYDERESVDLQAASDRVDELKGYQTRRAEIQQELTLLKRPQRAGLALDPATGKYRQALKGPQARETALRRKQLQRELKGLPEPRRLQRSIAEAENALGDAQSLPRRVVGLKPLDSADPTGSRGGAFREAFDLQNQSLVRALKGEEPIDPTLIRTFDERERALREQLRRQFGTDFESADAAREILSNFDRERAEAYQQFNREQITTFSGLSESRAKALSDLTSARLGQLKAPVEAQIGRAAALSGLAEDIGRFTDRQQARRRDLFDAQKAQFDSRLTNTLMKSAGTQETGQAIGKIGGAIGGAGGGGGGLSSFGGGK